MTHVLRGDVRAVVIPGARAAGAVVLSEDDWNAYASDCVVVPLFRDAVAAGSVIRPRLDEELTADCTLVTSIAQDDLGGVLRDCPEDVLRAVAVGVRAYLGIDRLLDRPRVRRAPPGRVGWWPRQGDVCRALRIADDPKWTVVVSEDDANAVLSHAAAVRLTSVGPKGTRRRWEVPVRGGFAVANDLRAVPYPSFDPAPSVAPPFPRLTADGLRALALRLVATLELPGGPLADGRSAPE